MWPYWLAYLSLAIPAASHANSIKPLSTRLVWLVAIILVLFIGLRHEVGGDWGNYFRQFLIYSRFSFADVVAESDPGYAFLNWLAQQFGLGIYTVNLACGALFSWGLIAFARKQPEPWLALAAGFPYLVMVVGMGYTRQGVAVGFILLALNALSAREFYKYLAFIALATLFHRTALILIPLGFFLFGRGWMLRSLAIGAAAFVLYDLLVAEEVETLWVNYIDAEMQSQGARIRVWMNLVPSVLLLVSWSRWRDEFPDYWFWFWIALGAIGAVVLVEYASTAVDRVSLYFIPIQLVVFSRLPGFMKNSGVASLIRVGIVLGYGLVLFVWLNFAINAAYWLPYQNALFV